MGSNSIGNRKLSAISVKFRFSRNNANTSCRHSARNMADNRSEEKMIPLPDNHVFVLANTLLPSALGSGGRIDEMSDLPAVPKNSSDVIRGVSQIPKSSYVTESPAAIITQRVFITAPHVVPPMKGSEEGEAQTSDERGWWFSQEDDSYNAQEVTQCCKGYDESVELVKQSIVEQGPFDGILAFSQGACMLSLVCCLRERNPDLFKFNFAIFVAGFKSRLIPHESFYETVVTIPTLHVFGDSDKVIPKEMSEALLPCYKDPVILQHPGGHFIPASSQQKQVYHQFLDKMAAMKS